jgi:putative phosphoesterase
MKIGVISDTHGWLDPQVFTYFQECDEIWHVGDLGSIVILEALENFKPVRAVYGNIDDRTIRYRCPQYQAFQVEGFDILMTHISGRPTQYSKSVVAMLSKQVPDILVGGHSHLLQVKRDPYHLRLLYINPGAAGKYGIHQTRTLLRLELQQKKINHIEAIDLGPRATIIPS